VRKHDDIGYDDMKETTNDESAVEDIIIGMFETMERGIYFSSFQREPQLQFAEWLYGIQKKN
jgi:hypothetical protein